MLTALASSALLLIYFISCLGLIVLQRRHVGDDIVTFRLPLGPLVPLVALVMVLGLMTTLAAREIVTVLVVVAFAAVTYWPSGRGRAAGAASGSSPG